MDKTYLKLSRGVTLIELLIALVISAIVIAGIYRTFIHQQRTFATQEQVADMQQNVRVAINKMIREIRMAGFGGRNENTGGNNDIISVFGNVNTFTNIVNPENDVTEDGITHDRITVVGGYDQIATLAADAPAGSDTVNLNYTGNTRFDTVTRRYMCINGRNNYEIVPTGGSNITLAGAATLNESHSTGEPVFLVRAIRYGIRVNNGVPVLFRDLYPNTGSSRRETVAENIENLQFRYVLTCLPQPCTPPESDLPENPSDIRGVRVTITARTRMNDPQLKVGDGFRRRTITSYIDLRNVRDDSP